MANHHPITKFLIPAFYSVLMLLMVYYAWNEQSIIRRGGSSPLYRDLMQYTAYVRRGFDQADIYPTVKHPAAGWVPFETRPLQIRNAPLPNLPKRSFLSPWGMEAEEFTILIAVEIDNKTVSYLEANPSVIPGIYFACIGENWEVFFNGKIVHSQIHRERRTWRNAYFPMDRSLIVEGTNFLALRIIGDPGYIVTGLSHTAPQYLDEYSAIQGRQYNFLLIILCGIFGFTGVYYLMIFFSVRSRREIFNLCFSVFSLLLCVYTFSRQSMINYLVPNSDIEVRLEFGSMMLLVPMFCVFIETLGRGKTTMVTRCYLAFCLFLVVTQIFFCAQYGEDVVLLWDMTIILYYSYFFFYDVIYFYFLDKKGPRFIDSANVSGTPIVNVFAGTLAIYLCGIYEILELKIFHNSVSLFQYGTFAVHIGMVFNLSQRFSGMYKQLEQSNILLETTVQERTRELKEQTAIAVGANRAKSEFLANMSHEIRTPMNSIVGFTELALDCEIAPKAGEYLGIIKNNTLGLLQIIDDILDISKVEYGKLELELIPFDLNEVFNHCRSIMAAKAYEKGLDLRFYTPEGKFELLGDPLRLRQILLNIISNAIKFTDKGFVEVSCSIRNPGTPLDAKSLAIQFAVKDSGTGMTAEQIERILKPFTQADSSITRKYGGTGLGLSISKSLIEMMGGKLAVESRSGEGSTFGFELNFDIAEDAQTNEDAIPEIDKPTFDGEVLVCEDNPWNRQLIVENLAKVGLRAAIAGNGMEAVNLVRQRIENCKTNSLEKPFDLILMDIQMPVMDGLEAASRIAQTQSETPIVAMTANIMSSDLELYKTKGMADCLGKPFSSQELWRCLLKYFEPVDHETVPASEQQQADLFLQKRFNKNFLQENEAKFTEISGALEAGDVVLARRLLHTLGGHAALIGKTGLQKICLDMEGLLKAGEEPDKPGPVTAQHLDNFKKELDAVLEEILCELRSEDELRDSAAQDKKQPLELLVQLQTKLEKRDPMFINMIDDIRAIPGTDELVSQMENYLLKQALVTVSKLIAERKEELLKI